MEARLISRFERRKESLISSDKFLQELMKKNLTLWTNIEMFLFLIIWNQSYIGKVTIRKIRNLPLEINMPKTFESDLSKKTKIKFRISFKF